MLRSTWGFRFTEVFMSKCQDDQDQGGRADLVTPPTDFCSTSVSLEQTGQWTFSTMVAQFLSTQFKINLKSSPNFEYILILVIIDWVVW